MRPAAASLVGVWVLSAGGPIARADGPIRSLRIEARQSYEGTKRVRLPIVRTLSAILGDLGVQVSRGAAAVLHVKVEGAALSTNYALLGAGFGTPYYTAATLEFTLRLEALGRSAETTSFRLESEPPQRIRMRWGGSPCRRPSCAPFGKAWRAGRKILLQAMIDFAAGFAGSEVWARALTSARQGVARAAQEAIRGARAVGDPKPFVRLLQHRQTMLRVSAAVALGRTGERESVDLVAPALGDPSPDVRAAAAVALGSLPGAHTVTAALRPLLRDGDANVRAHAVRVLAELGDPDAAAQLSRVAETGPQELRFAARRLSEDPAALRRVSELAAQAAASDAERRREVAVGLGRAAYSPRAEVELIGLLRDADERVRIAALASLSKASPQPSRLRPLLGDPSAEVRWQAALLLARARETGAIPVLVQGLRESKKADEAVRLLRSYSLEETFSAIAAVLRDADAAARARAADVFGLLGGDAAKSVAALRPLLQDPDESVRVAAEGALVSLGDPEGVRAQVRRIEKEAEARRTPKLDRIRVVVSRLGGGALAAFLAELLEHPSAEVRRFALAEIPPYPRRPELFARARRLLKDSDAALAEAAVTKLSELGDREAALDRLRQPGPLPRPEWLARVARGFFGPEGLAFAAELAKHGAPEIRRVAAERMLEIDTPAALERLRSLRDDTDARVRELAALGSPASDPQWVRAALRVAQPSSSIRARLIGRLVRALTPALVLQVPETLRHPDTWIRTQAFRLLERERDPAAFAIVRDLLKEPRRDLRQAATRWLGGLQGRDEAIELLIEALADVDRGVRQEAARSLSQLTGQSWGQNTAKWRQWWEGRRAAPRSTP